MYMWDLAVAIVGVIAAVAVATAAVSGIHAFRHTVVADSFAADGRPYAVAGYGAAIYSYPATTAPSEDVHRVEK